MSTLVKSINNTFLSVASLIILSLVVAGVIFSSNVEKVESSAGDNVSGYAWSDTIGWISMNCTDFGTCGVSDYGVSVDSSKYFSGYAWSDNIGWISFNAADVSGCPSGPCRAQIDSVSGYISGWARALSAVEAGVDAGGWDGWISFDAAGVNGVKVTGPVSGCTLSGWAWGSDVVGWVDFTGVKGKGDVCLSPTGDIDATSCEILPGESTCDSEVTWHANSFTGTPSVLLNGTEFSSSDTGIETKAVNFGSNVFKLDDLGPDPFFAQKTLNIGCVGGSNWAEGEGTCLLLPEIKILTDSDFIRNGDKAPLKIEITADYALECKLYGAAVASITFNHTPPAVPGEAKIYPYDTLPLTSAQIVRVECSLSGSPLINGEDEKRINVTASVEER